MAHEFLTTIQASEGINVGTVVSTTPEIRTGSADPESSVTAPPGSWYLRTNGSAYLKVSGTSNTGWTLMPTSAGSGIAATIFDAKGDLIVATAADTAARLAAGSNDQILMADSGATEGLKWVSPATPSTQAFGDAAAAGTGDTFTRGDHKHAMPADPVTAHEAAGDPHTVYLKEADFDDVDFLVGTATGHTAAEIVVGTSPGGELGGTWASPTVDATHSGSTHGAATTTHEAAADPHTGYVLESLIAAKGDLYVGTADNTVAVRTVGANDTILMADSAQGDGVKWVASGTPSTQAFGDAAAEGTTDGYTRTDHKHAMPANPVTGHEAAGDPHTGYRLESADHTHASTGAQAGQLDHGAALTGLTDDDHTIYLKEKASGGSAAEVPEHTHTAAGEGGAISYPFSMGATLLTPATGTNVMVWRAPFACTVTNVRSHFKGGTSLVYNARKNQASNHLASSATNSTADAWHDGGAVQNATFAAGDDLELMFVTVTGVITEATVQVDFTRS